MRGMEGRERKGKIGEGKRGGGKGGRVPPNWRSASVEVAPFAVLFRKRSDRLRRVL